MEPNQHRPPSCPIETYTFRFPEEERKTIHKKQIRPTRNAAIICALAIAILILCWLLFDLSDVVFGILVGVFLICGFINLIGVLSFRKTAAASMATACQREYVYEVFEEKLRIEIYDNGEKIGEEVYRYADIQAVSDIGDHLLLTITGRIFIIRKADLSENSRLLTALGEPIQKIKTVQKKRRVAGVVALACITVGMILMVFGTLYTQYQNDQAIADMKEVISETYDEYEFLTHFHVHKDGRFIDHLILIEYEGKVDVLGYARLDEKLMTVDKLLGLTPDRGAVTGQLADESHVVMQIHREKADIPEDVAIREEITYDGQTMYFCLTYID